ncbi:MAG: hypothetical protein Q9185_001746 [Variospora sp. 1 TL-2023]
MPLLRPSLLSSLAEPLRSTFCRAFTTTRPTRLAKMSIVGRLAAEPELVPTSTGQDVIRYALGTAHGSRDNRQTSWWKVGAFISEGAVRDTLMGLGKGSLLYVEGTCTMQKFEDKEGQQRNALNIVQRHFEVLDKRDGGGNLSSGSDGDVFAPAGYAAGGPSVSGSEGNGYDK